MKSLYGQYIKEREDKDIVESDKGFATYKILDSGECYLEHLYVAPEYRKTGLAKEMTDQVVEIAKAHGCKILVGSVAMDASEPTRNMKIFLGYGMQIHSIKGSMIYLIKNIAGEV